MPIKPHPTDPDKMVYVKREYNLPKEWVGLTEEERLEILGVGGEAAVLYVTEAKLREKNRY